MVRSPARAVPPPSEQTWQTHEARGVGQTIQRQRSDEEGRAPSGGLPERDSAGSSGGGVQDGLTCISFFKSAGMIL